MPTANAIVAAMEKRGYRVWYDAKINAGTKWKSEIANKISECEAFMMFISTDFINSHDCMDEAQHAHTDNRKIVPVKMNLDRGEFPETLKYLLQDHQGFSMHDFPTAEAFVTRLDTEPLFQCCRAETTQTPAPLAEIVTQSRPAAPSGAFVGREDKIQAIEDAFRNGQTAVVLYGMGGIGKSEICRKLFWEYAHGAGTHLAGRIGWAMWRGTPKETFYGQFRDIREENAEIHWQQARAYLETLGRDLLMFLDNADTLTETDAAELTQLGCRFLITSRKRPGRLFAVPAGTLTPEQCRILYRRALYEDDACTDAAPDAALDEILRLAAYHTLSVQLLAKTPWAAGLESAEMLSQLRESGFDRSGEDIAYLHNPEQKQNIEEEAAFIDHMSRVFDLSQLRSDADALRALQGMSLLAPNTPIPVRDVKKWLDLPNLNGLNRAVKLGWLNDALENGIRKISIHPVISDIVRHNSSPDAGMIDAIAGRLSQDMIPDTTEVYTTKLPVAKHAIALNRVTDNLSTGNYAGMLHHIGALLHEQADYNAALSYLKQAAKMAEEVLGSEHPNTATAYNNIGEVYKSQGNYDSALQWHQKALQINEKILGAEHPDTAVSYDNLSGIYLLQRDYNNALKYNKRALRVFKKVLEPEHPKTATAYNNMGIVYFSQRNYDSALQCFQKALRIREKVLGSRHLNTAITYQNIGVLYFYKGDYTEALKWLGKALDVRLKVLGSEHPSTKSAQAQVDFTRRLSEETKE